MSDSTSTERKTVKTYVPNFQKQEWKNQAHESDMTLSEFVRVMVQSGRNAYFVDRQESPRPDVTPGGNGLKTRILDILQSNGPKTFDELVDAISSNIETDVEHALNELQSEQQLEHTIRGKWSILESAVQPTDGE